MGGGAEDMAEAGGFIADVLEGRRDVEGDGTGRDGISGAVHAAAVCAVGCATKRTPGSSLGAWIASSLRSSQ
ncbi:MAG: hypothetical protein JO122_15490 [Acetobacteraceae bacterium]|nr:hypothetical protein [Acetobacteraceae bacterium]